ncbi:hypothetical protein [Streptomyces neyagawaensis]|uniref:hypothetical protein n=1 Tax=Streptomyces neyagawaensis TaxID=42238 RepID=UPI0006E2AE72|nr:hypothetical protein [Streptomyces neyagawaensis]MCL6736276.1 hypothetical protein [Streptomyces neyagawaensis]MDE1684237.1 hypothetical protein [Streptomyces neyagawaensis]
MEVEVVRHHTEPLDSVGLLQQRDESSRLVGHSGTAVTEGGLPEADLRPVIQTEAVIMDGIFGAVRQQP